MNDPKVKKIHDERILQYFSQSIWNTEIAVLGVIAAITLFLYVQIESYTVWFWLAQALLVQPVRLFLATLIVDQSKGSVEFRIRLAVLLALTGGLSMGSVLVFSPQMTIETMALISMILVGSVAGSLATCHGFRPIYFAFVVPIFLSLLYIWVFASGGEISTLYRSMVVFLVIQLSVVFYVLTVRVYETFCESLIAQDKLQLALHSEKVANSAKTRFLATASHDLRQPLHAMALFSAALTVRPLDDTSKSIANKMNDAMQALAEELDSLLDISKLDAGIVPVEPKNLSLSLLVDRVATLFEPRAEEKKIEFIVEVEDDLFINSDTVLVERMIRNIVDNAIKYTHSGRVTFRLFSESNRAVIEVIDTGCGIDVAEQAQIWEEFYQVGNESRDRQKGLGLGLSVVSRLADMLDLKVDVHSEKGEGSHFTISIPIAPLNDHTDFDRHEYPCDFDLEDIAGRHALIVDDDEDVQLGTMALLVELGMTVSVADGTAKAIEVVKAEAIDVVLMDLRLSNGDDGFDSIVKLREIKQDIPVIVVSGDTGPERLKKAASLDCTWLVKPVKADLLVNEFHRIFL